MKFDQNSMGVPVVLTCNVCTAILSMNSYNMNYEISFLNPHYDFRIPLLETWCHNDFAKGMNSNIRAWCTVIKC